MQYTTLGSSGLRVSRVCLGTMTWGQQNTQADADAQLALALDAGVNFIDTAEMYAIPPRPETYGATEQIIGNWLSRNSAKREQLVLATKIAGNGLKRRNRLNATGASEAVFLEPLLEFALANETPAERKLALFHGEWKGSVDPVFKEFAY